MEDNLFIYILKLQSGKYYVGKTKDIFTRLDAHRNGTACTWTKKYKPIFAERIIERASIFDEDKFTKEYMNKHGINNVRGGSYVMEVLTDDQIEFLSKELIFANDRCLKCGGSDHFQVNCSLNAKVYNKTNKKVYNNPKTYDKNNIKPKTEKDSNKPSNKGKKWSESENNDLCKNYERGASISDLAKIHQRTEGAIESRLKKIGKLK